MLWDRPGVKVGPYYPMPALVFPAKPGLPLLLDVDDAPHGSLYTCIAES